MEIGFFGGIIPAMEVAKQLFPPEVNNADKVERYSWTRDLHLEAWRGLPMVKLDQLNIDTSYQRTIISDSVLKNICKNFDARQFSPVVVSRKTCCIIDGDHRVLAAIRRGDLHYIPARFVDLIDRKAEADLFVKLNTFHNAVRAVDKFRANIAADDNTAKSITNDLLSLGMHVGNSASPNVITCVAQLQRAYKQNPQKMHSALFFLRQVDSTKQISKSVFDAAFYCATHGVELVRYVEKVRSAGGFSVIIQTGKTLLIEMSKGAIRETRSEKVMGIALLSIINKGLRKKVYFTDIEG